MKAVIVLSLALGGSALLAVLARQPSPASPGSEPAALSQDDLSHAATMESLPEQAGPVIDGQALEVIDVPGYTYVRVGQPGSEGEWAAVATAKIDVGQKIRVRTDTKLENFSSSTLKREFASIYFGSLDDGASAAVHGSTGFDLSHGSPALDGQNPHGKSPAATVEIGQVEPAPGGLRVAQLFAQKRELAGKPVRVRGVVVKSVDGVLGKSFVHLQDGSGTSEKKDHDLTVTMADPPKVGETLLVEGNLVADKDVGAGYRYDILVEDARVLERKGP